MEEQLIDQRLSRNYTFFQNSRPVGICQDLDIWQQLKQTQKSKHVARAKIKCNKSLISLEIQEDMNTQKNGHWSHQENIKYLLFLKTHRLQFQQKNLRRAQRIFKYMSDYLKTRTASQCRSHHQKMEKKCQSFQKILIYLNDICSHNPVPSNQLIQQYNKISNEKKKDEIMMQVSQQRKTQQLHWHQIEIDDDLSQISYYEMPKILHPCYFVRQKSERESTGGDELSKMEEKFL